MAHGLVHNSAQNVWATYIFKNKYDTSYRLILRFLAIFL